MYIYCRPILDDNRKKSNGKKAVKKKQTTHIFDFFNRKFLITQDNCNILLNQWEA